MLHPNHNYIHKTVTLLKDTTDLTEPVLYKNYFDNKFLNEELVKYAINEAIKYKAKDNFKIWVNRSDQNNFAHDIIETPIKPDENLENWAKRIFGKEKFCILFSRAEQFNDDVAIKIGKFLHPILQYRGFSLGGCSLTFLLGNYGYTPSGVHQDQDEDCIFHFHLGPGSKQLFTWDPEEFQKITGSSDAYHEPEKIIKHARAFTLSANDFLALPPKNYHIGRTDNFSIDVVAVLSDSSNVRFTQELFKSLTQDCLAKRKSIYKLDKVRMDNDLQSIVSSSFNHICMNQQNRSKIFEDVINSQIEDFYLTMLSNLGWSFPPILDSETTTSITGKRVQIIEPFKIYYKVIDKDKMAIYMRGRELIAKNYPITEVLIDKLNSAQIFHVEDLHQGCSASMSDIEFIASFLKVAIEHKAIKVMADS